MLSVVMVSCSSVPRYVVYDDSQLDLVERSCGQIGARPYLIEIQADGGWVMGCFGDDG